MRWIFIWTVLLTSCLALPGRAQNLHPDTLSEAGILRYDFYDHVDGFYLFVPDSIQPGEQLGLVVFLHGYGALNPLNYGAWIEKIISQRQAIIYPRYQRNLLWPTSEKFAGNVARGIRSGLEAIASQALPVDTSSIVYVGHSYGGVLSSYMLARQDSLGLPPGFGALLSAPGTAKLSGSRLESYAAIPADVQLLVVSHAGDALVGDEFPRLLMGTTDRLKHKVWIRQQEEMHGEFRIGHGHNECYALSEELDTGYRNYTTRKALRRGKIDALDSLLYWSFTVDLLDARRGQTLHPVFEREDVQYSLGCWQDGVPRKGPELDFGIPRLTPVNTDSETDSEAKTEQNKAIPRPASSSVRHSSNAIHLPD